jgi:hypothetical protein
VLTILVAGAVILPVAILVFLGAARLLDAMQDAAASGVFDRVALGVGVLWALDLVCLVLALGINALGPPGGNR